MDSRSFDLYQHLRADLFRYVGGDCAEYTTAQHFNVWPGISLKQFACIHLLNNILKKFEGATAEDAEAKAAALFLDMNNRCKDFSDVCKENITELESMAVDYALSELHQFFIDDDGFALLNAPRILANLGVGPGASVGTSGNSHFHKFFGGPITCTSAGLARLIADELATNNPSLAEAESIRREFFGDVRIVPGNVLSFAYKNTTIARVICTEPSENMKFQKGIQYVLERQLERRFGINLSVQPEKNALLCKIGSMNQHYDSTDLRSASDCVAYLLLKRYIPSGSFGWLNASRSPGTTVLGDFHELHMMSSMGNAFTFPLQTTLFSCIVIGCYKALGIDVIFPRGGAPGFGGSLGNFGVFGDDIVTVARATDLVHRVLTRFGFLVNKDKSFSDGDFRESCGSDYKSGHDVRAVYVRTLNTPQDVACAYNLLSAWSCNQDVKIPSTLALLRSWGIGEVPDVPPHEGVTAGFWTPLAFARGVTLDENGAALYNRYVPKSRSLRIERRGRDRVIKSKPGKKKRHKPWCVNNLGFIISASAGYARGGEIMLRQPAGVPPKYQKLIGISPGWDYTPIEFDGYFTRRGFARWRRKTSARDLAW
jgi:hypothetical protein